MPGNDYIPPDASATGCEAAFGRPQRYLGLGIVITNIYVDGFNLYYGALRGTPYKWLNPLQMCQVILKPYHAYHRLRYFTALVKARPHDPDQPVRQEAYLRAVGTIPGSTVHYGYYLAHEVMMPLATDPRKKVRVIKTEEKGSDVNLATYLLVDGFRGDYECAVVVSNDSDLVEPIRIVRDELKRTVVVLNPHRKQPAQALQNTASLFRTIREHALLRSQFPAVLTDAQGRTIRKPSSW